MNAHSPIRLWQRGQYKRIVSALTLDIEDKDALEIHAVLRLWECVEERDVLGTGVELRDADGNGTGECNRSDVGDPDGATEADREVEERLVGSIGVGSVIVHPNNAVNMAASDGSDATSTSMESVSDEIDGESSKSVSLWSLKERSTVNNACT
jgi:hypothetical protein